MDYGILIKILFFAFTRNVGLLSQQNWWIILSVLIPSVLGPLFVHFGKNIFDNSKKIIISGNVISNINNKSGVKEPIVSNPKVCSNFIFNHLTVENKRRVSQAITEIELYDIKKQDYLIQDIQYDGGFYDKNQKFVLLAYNNGNTDALSNGNSINYYVYESILQEGHLIKNIQMEKTIIKSGDVQSLIIDSFVQFYDLFETHDKLQELKVVVVDRKGKELKNLLLWLHYDRENKKFVNHPRGFAGASIEDVPLLNLTTDAKKQSVGCIQKVLAGANEVDFTILVDRTCQLEYKIKLKSGKKSFKDKNTYNLIIRMPVYVQERGGFFGDFYQFLLVNNNNLENSFKYDKDLIASLNKELIFDRYKAARKFARVKI